MNKKLLGMAINIFFALILMATGDGCWEAFIAANFVILALAKDEI